MKRAQEWRETSGAGGSDVLIDWLFILLLCKQIFPCPAGVLACTID